MPLRNQKPVRWAPAGLTDALDGTEDFPGALNLQSNLISAQNQKGLLLARAAAIVTTSLPDIVSGAPLSCLTTVGNWVYGMYPSTSFSGKDVPFAYNLATNSFASISGMTSGNLPTSPAASGAWTPPTAASVAARILFTHPGFSGGSSLDTFFIFSSGNLTNGSNQITGFPFPPLFGGAPIGALIYDATNNYIPAGTTIVSQETTNITATNCNGTSGNSTFTVGSAAGLAVGDFFQLPYFTQYATIGAIAGTTITLAGGATLTGNFSNAPIVFYTSVVTISKNATGSNNTSALVALPTISNKFGWLDTSGFSVNITGGSSNPFYPIIVGDFDVTGIQPGMTIAGPDIPSNTTILAAGSMTFSALMSLTAGSTNFTDGSILAYPSAEPTSYITGGFQQGQGVSGPGIASGSVIASVSLPVGIPYLTASTGTLSLPATSNETAVEVTIQNNFLILSQNPTASSFGNSYTIAGGTQANPLWAAGDLQVLPLAGVPVFVSSYGGSACYGVNTTAPQTAAVVISDAGIPCQCSNASQVITFENGIPVSAAAGLPLQNQLGGIIQSLIAFQGGSNAQQITGTPSQGNLSLNTSQVATGTLSPNSVVSTPKGLIFQAPDGLRLLDFDGVIHDPIGVKGDGIINPFINCTVPSRSAAAFSGNVYRITVTWQPPVFLQNLYGSSARTDEFWLHLDTGKFSGPHTCTMDLIAPWTANNSFVGGLMGGRGSLWRSDPYVSPNSLYVENGSQLNWTLQTVQLPDDETDEANSLVESSVWASMDYGTSWVAALIDDQGITQAAVHVSQQGLVSTQAQTPIYWPEAIAFRQASIQLTGMSQPVTLIGAFFLRFQKTGYPLPAYPYGTAASAPIPSPPAPSLVNSLASSTPEIIVSSPTGNVVLSVPSPPTPFGANIMAYGGDNTGVHDNSTALALALAASNCVLFPPGTYLFNASFAFTIPSGERYTFVGAGQDATILAFAAGNNGLACTMGGYTSSIGVYGMTIATKDATGTYIGLSITQSGVTGPPVPSSIIQDVAFRGFDGWGATDYWLYGIKNASNNFNYISCGFCGPAAIAGIGAIIEGSSASQISVVHDFIGCDFSALNEGVVYGPNSQGITFNQCNFTGVNYGVDVPSGQTGNDQLTVIGSQLYCYTACIAINSPIADVIVENSLFIHASGSQGIFLNNYYNCVISGNCFETAAAGSNFGVVFDTYSARASVVTGNSFNGLHLAVYLESASQFVNVQSNVYSGCATNVLNSGSNNTVGGGSQ